MKPHIYKKVGLIFVPHFIFADCPGLGGSDDAKKTLDTCLLCRGKVFCEGIEFSVQGSSLLCRGKVFCAGVKSSVQGSSLRCRIKSSEQR